MARKGKDDLMRFFSEIGIETINLDHPEVSTNIRFTKKPVTVYFFFYYRFVDTVSSKD